VYGKIESVGFKSNPTVLIVPPYGMAMIEFIVAEKNFAWLSH
jgi:hypothetical protein